MLTNQDIATALAGNRGATVLPEIEYRKMRALERIVELLEKLAAPPTTQYPSQFANPAPDDLRPGPTQYEAPEPKHFIRRRRAQGEPE